MQTAWYAFAVWGRPAHPRLRVCFAMLAGLAPLHRERLLARGGDVVRDPGVFLDVSSYGLRADRRGAARDRRRPARLRLRPPASSPPVTSRSETRCWAALRERNPTRLLGAKTMEMAV